MCSSMCLSTSGSPSKENKDSEIVQLSKTELSSVSAGENVAATSGTAVPSEVTKEESEDQGVSPSHDNAKADDYSLDMVRKS